MNDRRREAEVRGAHLHSVLKRAVVPEFPSGARLVLVMADHTGVGYASTMPDDETLSILGHLANHLVDDDDDDDDDDGDHATYMRVGDVVEACKDCGHVLRSGPQVYQRAVVVCTSPLMLVSECASMLLPPGVKNLHLHFVGEADPWLLKRCLILLPKQ